MKELDRASTRKCGRTHDRLDETGVVSERRCEKGLILKLRHTRGKKTMSLNITDDALEKTLGFPKLRYATRK